MFERIRYSFWRAWLISSAPFDSPIRFLLRMRIITVYDPLFKSEGLASVKKAHADHVEDMRKKLCLHNWTIQPPYSHYTCLRCGEVRNRLNK